MRIYEDDEVVADINDDDETIEVVDDPPSSFRGDAYVCPTAMPTLHSSI